MAALLRAFRSVVPPPSFLDCGCVEIDQPVYGCVWCGRRRCEQHRPDPHDCAKEAA